MAIRVTNLESGQLARVAWTATPADYDIAANDPGKGAEPGLANPSEGRPSRWVYIGTSGNLSFVGLDGVTVSAMPVIAGIKYEIQMIKLLAAASTALGVTVVW